MDRKKNLALLCDYGLDDAIATAYLLKHTELFDRIDILPVGGNFPLQECFVNTKRVLWAVKQENPTLALEKLRIVDTSALPQPEERIADIHGNDGMGDVLPISYEETAEVISYASWLNAVDESYSIVSLGPCTVTQDILEKKGALPLCFMCGNISEPPNYKGYEFNHGVNPEAFSACVKYPHVAATLDSCHTEKGDLNGMELDTGDTLGVLLNRYRELSNQRKEPACYVYDLTVAVWLVHPERFTTEVMTDPYGNVITVLRYISDLRII